jgi:hypothetical protein
MKKFQIEGSAQEIFEYNKDSGLDMKAKDIKPEIKACILAMVDLNSNVVIYVEVQTS